MKRVVLSIVLLSCALLHGQSYKPVDQQKLEQAVTAKMEMDRDGEFKDWYTIQIFTGNLKEAQEKLKEFKKSNLSWECRLQYEAPYHKLWVGTFRHRLLADRALVKVKEVFEDAVILKP